LLLKGSLRVRKYQNQDGENRYATEVVADKVWFCGDKGKDALAEFKNEVDQARQNEFEEIDDDGDIPF
jgi:single-stranded DNA-binding protein